MAEIVRAVAFANNEVAFVAWAIDAATIPGCLGFHIVREYLDGAGQIVEERPLASYVAFKGQSNPEWLAQNTTVWPIQKFTWRDLTLRKRRDGARRRPDNERVRYRIRAVGKLRSGLEPVLVLPESHRERGTGIVVEHTYQGRPIALGYLTPAARSNVVDVTGHRPPFTTAFTNGILSTQFLLRVLEEDGKIEPGELEAHLRKPGDWLRNYLAGDVIPLLRGFFAQPKGRFHAALYELEDEELVRLLASNAQRLDLILSDAGSGKDESAEPDANASLPTVYDTRNAPARASLRQLAEKRGTRFRLQDRMFNGSGHIGHNKFVVYVDQAGKPKSVLTGSTNWTWSGLAGQSNNCIRIDDSDVALAYLNLWKRLHADVQPVPNPLSSKARGVGQGEALKQANLKPALKASAGCSIETWFSPNVPGKRQPPAANASKASPPPVDMNRVFSLMRSAKRAILFLVFMPSRGGLNSIVSEAVALGLKDSTLQVVGAISDTQAMWGYEARRKDAQGNTLPASSPHVFKQGGISVIRATALTDKEIGRELGDFQFDEKLTLGRAIIHDKILVLDPTDPVDCTVVFGSHNLGYKASYSNDENLVIVRGHRELALAYATHVLDVHDHYRFRAVEAELSARVKATGKGASRQWTGFLSTSDSWQKKASRRLSTYFTSMAPR